MRTVKIEGDEHSIYYGMAELAEFTEKYGIKLSEMINHEMSLSELGYLVHLGLKGGAEMKDKEYKKTPKQTLRVIDKTKGLIKVCMEVFSSSINTVFDDDEDDEPTPDADTKKK